MKHPGWKMAALVLAVLAVTVVCDEPGRDSSETKTVALEGAQRAEVSLRMGAGELRVRGADQEALLEAEFRFNRERFRPAVDYRLFGDKGILEVRQARRRGIPLGNVRSTWDLSLTQTIPLDLDIDLGAGESRLDLRGLALSKVDIDMGVGEMRLDLSGPHRQSFRVKIDGGIGSIRLDLPSETGVRIKVDKGIGSVDTRGLSKQEGYYVNEAFGRSEMTIDIDIDAGIGSVDLRVEPAGRI
ncbi:MAG: toast rack family protein [Candidatus Aminicenantes bacterium]